MHLYIPPTFLIPSAIQWRFSILIPPSTQFPRHLIRKTSAKFPSFCLCFHPDPSPNMPPAVKPLVLAPLPICKPPMPSLAHPLNVTAYTQPDIYANYLDSILTPSTENIANSSLTTIVDLKALTHLHEENGCQLITHEFDE